MIYLDSAASQKPYQKAVDIATKVSLCNFANPSSVHRLGRDAEDLLLAKRESIASLVAVNHKNIIFTSSASEANNIIINSINPLLDEIYITGTVHSSIFEAISDISYQKDKKHNIKYLSLDDDFGIDIDCFQKLNFKSSSLIAVNLVSSDTARIQDISTLLKIAKQNGFRGIFHVDATQGLGKIHIDISKLDIDSMAFSSHKFGGIRGAGFLYVKNLAKIKKFILGGNQEFGYRAGTENLAAISAMDTALSLALDDIDINYKSALKLSKKLKEYLSSKEDIFLISKDSDKFSPYIISFAFKNQKSEILLRIFDANGICVSSGSACSLKSSGISRVSKSLNIANNLKDGIIRVSISHETTVSDIDKFIEICEKNIISKYRSLA